MPHRPAAHLAIPVNDLTAARDFYGKVLGLTEGRSTDHWVDWNLEGHQLVTHVVAAASWPIGTRLVGPDAAGNAWEFKSFRDESMVFAR
ncbi:VOC family protein [Streptomyces sp. NPDC046939]|uniref:VOC family protein n=1 Tax=Streptomyces sp. NPDC046939 TaxID=3155376 RepID=UPI0033D96892